jgi:hypothetical protein
MRKVNSRKPLVLAVVSVVAGVVAVFVLVHRRGTTVATPPTEHAVDVANQKRQPAPDVALEPAAREPSRPQATALADGTPASPKPSGPAAASTAATSEPKASAEFSLKYNGYEVQDPTARLALYFVGSDPEATAYWMAATNDPSLPAEERKDLIEDLNEDGFPDPHHPSPADVPLIENRLWLIGELAPYSMDQVNADAFGEAYKDLWGMLYGQAPQ